MCADSIKSRVGIFIAELTGYGEDFIVLPPLGGGRPAIEYTIAELCARLALPDSPTVPAPVAITEPLVIELLSTQFGVPREAITPSGRLGDLLASS